MSSDQISKQKYVTTLIQIGNTLRYDATYNKTQDSFEMPDGNVVYLNEVTHRVLDFAAIPPPQQEYGSSGRLI